MRPLHQFTVTSNVPPSLHALEAIAANLQWAWTRQLAQVFDRLDGSPTGRSWRETGQHPVDLIRRTSPGCWDALAADDQYVEQVARAHQRLDDALVERPLFAGDDRPEHAVGETILLAQLMDALANRVRVAAAHRAVGAGRVQPLEDTPLQHLQSPGSTGSLLRGLLAVTTTGLAPVSRR